MSLVLVAQASLAISEPRLAVARRFSQQQLASCDARFVKPCALAVCEAKSASLPIVGANVGGLSEISDLVFPSEDSSSLGAHLNLLIDNKQLRLELGCQSYHNYLAYFSIQKGVDEYCNLYYNVTSAG